LQQQDSVVAIAGAVTLGALGAGETEPSITTGVGCDDSCPIVTLETKTPKTTATNKTKPFIKSSY
jgi:hypothetical protein